MSSGTVGTIASLRESQYFKQRGPSEISRFPEDVKQLLEQIKKRCGKVSVAKVNPPPSSIPLMLIVRSVPPKQEETSQLAKLCDALNNLLSDRSLISQQPNYDDIKRPVHGPPSIHLPLTWNNSDLVKVEEQLIGWSKLNFAKSWSKF